MNVRQYAKEISSNYRDKTWWQTVADSFYKRRLLSLYDTVGEKRTNPLEKDWDTLLILDACRYDLFTSVSGWCENVEKSYSVASATPEFVKKVFADQTLHDTVYVTANPQAEMCLDTDSIFHDTVDLWEVDWDDELNTVRPEKVRKATKKAREKYPQKRIISHFMQPHYPFIGPQAQDLIGEHAGYSRIEEGKDISTNSNPGVWLELRRENVSVEGVWKSYKENLEICLKHVEILLSNLDERVVITSDHGNSLGEWATPFPFRIWGHPASMHVPELIEVPWLVIENEDRPTITSEENVSSFEESDETVIQSRLEDLGYV